MHQVASAEFRAMPDLVTAEQVILAVKSVQNAHLDAEERRSADDWLSGVAESADGWRPLLHVMHMAAHGEVGSGSDAVAVTIAQVRLRFPVSRALCSHPHPCRPAQALHTKCKRGIAGTDAATRHSVVEVRRPHRQPRPRSPHRPPLPRAGASGHAERRHGR